MNRGRDMSHLIAPLDILLSSGEIQSIGIGDGGNEVGMGKVLSTLNSSDCVIPNASMIACVVPATYLVLLFLLSCSFLLYCKLLLNK